MRQIPELDYTCSRCGHRETLQLVKVDRHGIRHDDDPPAVSRAIATPDYTCSRCGANETLTLVKTRPARA
jgi:DNA-directed RNA polymerase subunit RPC12/RpoP